MFILIAELWRIGNDPLRKRTKINRERSKVALKSALNTPHKSLK